MSRRIILSLAAVAVGLSPYGYTQVKPTGKVSPPTPESETVYLSAHGKTYHRRKNCLALSRAHAVFISSEAEAKSHGLKRCDICWRETAAKSNRPDNADWAKPAEEEK